LIWKRKIRQYPAKPETLQHILDKNNKKHPILTANFCGNWQFFFEEIAKKTLAICGKNSYTGRTVGRNGA
jgi:hypothetical protein